MNTTAKKNGQVNADIREVLTANGSDELASRVNKALTKKSTKTTELEALLDEVIKAVPNTEDKKPVEKKAKKTTEKKPVEKALKKKSEQPKAEEPKEEKKSEKKPTAKPKANDKKSEKTEKKEPPKVEATKGNKTALPIAKMFPKEINLEGTGVLRAVADKYKTFKEIVEAIENEKEFYFATYWTKAHIKKFQYAEMHNVAPIPKGFPMDLDIQMPIHYLEKVKRIITASVYTEAVFAFNEDEIQHITDKDPYTGEEYRVRVSGGCEFEIYELVESGTEE